MDISRVKYNLGKLVRLQLPRHYVDGKYLLTGCIIRKNNKSDFFYQAELTEPDSKSIVISELGAVEEIAVDCKKLDSPTVRGQN